MIKFEILMYFSLLGASLAQDRGRLEVRIEVLSAELENQKKQNERDNDALKIKAKIVDDQTETIRRLKEVVGLIIIIVAEVFIFVHFIMNNVWAFVYFSVPLCIFFTRSVYSCFSLAAH